MPVGIWVAGSVLTAGVPIQLCPRPWQVMQPDVKPVWFIGGTALASAVLSHQANFDVAGSPFAIVRNGFLTWARATRNWSDILAPEDEGAVDVLAPGRGIEGQGLRRGRVGAAQ